MERRLSLLAQSPGYRGEHRWGSKTHQDPVSRSTDAADLSLDSQARVRHPFQARGAPFSEQSRSRLRQRTIFPLRLQRRLPDRYLHSSTFAHPWPIRASARKPNSSSWSDSISTVNRDGQLGPAGCGRRSTIGSPRIFSTGFRNSAMPAFRISPLIQRSRWQWPKGSRTGTSSADRPGLDTTQSHGLSLLRNRQSELSDLVSRLRSRLARSGQRRWRLPPGR